MDEPTTIVDLPTLPTRKPESHKGTYGKVLVVAGHRGMSGAAVLCGTAALRSGAGLVQVATPQDIQFVVAGSNPCYTTAALPIDYQGEMNEDAITAILDLASRADVLAIGPGIGLGPKMPAVIEYILLQCQLPIVLDADGISALAEVPIDVFRRREAPTVLTPHPGEFGRLLRKTAEEVQANRQALALEYARSHRVILVLKGHGTLVTDGQRLYRNSTGNPGMATGGTGDVLTGVIAALIAQGMTPFDAAQLGVWIHGRAGDLAAAEYGPVSTMASDVLNYLPKAFQNR